MKWSMSKQFQSFIWAGYECSAAKTENGRRLNMLRDTRHDVLCAVDYNLIKAIGVTTVREGFNWSTIEIAPDEYDFSQFENTLQLGQSEGIQQVWDLTHFDYPEFYDPFAPEFAEKFAQYSVVCLKKLREFISGTLYIAPINEISFFAWIGADMGWWAPYKKGRHNGFLLKQALVKAAIAAMDSLWAIDADIKFIQIDPFMRRLATEPAKRSAKKHVKEFNEVVRFEAWDLLAGKKMPELGGDMKYMNYIGVNYYIHNQEWVISLSGKRGFKHQLMDWDSSDRIPLSEMLRPIVERYQRPIIITETGSFGEHRERWWQRLLQEVDDAKAQGIPIEAVCIYPTVDRPEKAGFLLPNSGIWDFRGDDEACERIPHQASINTIAQYQAMYSDK